MDKKRIIFMGTPKIAATCLEALVKYYEIVFVVTQPDKKKDRHGKFIFSEVKEFCIKNNIAFYQPEKLKMIENEIKTANPDLIVTCAFGQIVPQRILDIPKYKCINFHASLLPKLRGAAPMQTAIIKGYKSTGLTLMYMDRLMDHGNIIETMHFKLNPYEENYLDLYQKMQEAITKMINDKTLDKLFDENVVSKVQNEAKATYTMKFTKENSYINFNWGGKRIVCFVNGLYGNEFAKLKINDSSIQEFKIGKVEFIPFISIDSNAYKKQKNGSIVEVSKKHLYFKVRDGLISIKQIQAPSRKMLDIISFLSGNNPLGIKKD